MAERAGVAELLLSRRFHTVLDSKAVGDADAVGERHCAFLAELLQVKRGLTLADASR